MSEITDAQAIIEAAREAVDPVEVHSALLYAVRAGDSVSVLDLEHYNEHPRRKVAQTAVTDAASFLAYLSKHAEPETEIYADLEGARVVAIVDAHGDLPGWRDHRVILGLRKTPAWTAWMSLDRKMLDQVTFSQHVEDRVVDVVRPSGAEMLELAQTFQAKTKVSFESSKRLQSGEQQLQYVEETTASAGRKGDVTIPDTFTVALVPYEGGAAYKVTARLRYRITEGRLSLGYFLDRPEDVLREAFAEIVTSIAAAQTAPVFHGKP